MTTASLAFPWPTREVLRGPAVRAAIADIVWRAHVRRRVERWRALHAQPLPLVAYDRPALLDVPCDDRWIDDNHLIDVLEVSLDQLAATARAIAQRGRSHMTVGLLCRSSLANAEHQAAATDLLREAGARLVIASPRELARLEELITQVALRRPPAASPLEELPLRCWGPPWQQPR